jgi:hypothetical protein
VLKGSNPEMLWAYIFVFCIIPIIIIKLDCHVQLRKIECKLEQKTSKPPEVRWISIFENERDAEFVPLPRKSEFGIDSGALHWQHPQYPAVGYWGC